MQVEDPTAGCEHETIRRYVTQGVEEWRCIDCNEPFTNSSKLGACVTALENLLPGLILDLRYADPDDDREAMQSRIKTVTDALTTAEGTK